MQRFAYLLACCILSFWVSGQKVVTQGEYYWDTDPGQGNGIALNATDGGFDEVLEDLFQNGISVAALSQGAHSFNVRVKGQNGTWSNIFKQTIYVEGPLSTITRTVNLTQGEYYWDADPGQGNGIPLLALDGTFDEVLEDLFQNGISVAALSQGAHSFSVRVKGQDGQWSNSFKQTIYLEGPLTTITRTVKVTQGEYFWDADPGTGSGTPLLSLDGTFDEVLEDLFQNGINVSALSQGAHSFNVRIKGQDGQWSSAFKQTIYLEGPLTLITRTVKITQGEYFWDTDPGAGSGTPLLALDGTFDEALEDLFQNGISVAALSQGAHNFNVRVKGQDGQWSTPFKQTIYLEGPLTLITRTVKVTQGEYFWDTDPGQGNGIQLLVVDGTFDEALEDLFKNGVTVSTLSLGAHSFNARVKGQDGAWSNVFKQTIYLEGPLTMITRTFKITQGEYFWDADPGAGNGIPLLSADGVFDETLEDLFRNGIDVSALSLGAHNFNVRVKGQDGQWSLAFKQTIYLEGPLSLVTRNYRITQGEYFWDADPGQGNGTPLLAADGNFNTVLETLIRNNISPSFLSLGAHNFSVRVKGFDGAWSNVFKQTIYIECSSPTAPTISIAVTGNGACEGTVVQFTATSVNGGNTPIYLWKVNGIPAGTNSPLFGTSTLVNGDVVTCELTSNSGCASPTSAVSNSIAVTLSSTAAPTISVTASTGTTICSGTSVTFTAAIANGGGSPAYQWYVNGINVGNNSSTFVTNTLLNNDVVTCQLTSSAVCAIPASVTSSAITMNVVNFVTPVITISTASNIVCSGSNVSFTASASGQGGSPAYQWKVNGLNVGTNNSVFTTSTLNNGDVVTCVLTSSLSCVTSSTATSNGITITTNPVVSASVSISSSSGSTSCFGNDVIFTAAPINGGPTPGYQWYLNGSMVGFNSSTYVVASLTTGDVVYCQMFSSLNCASPSVTSSNSITMTVYSQSAPTATISSNQGSGICAGGTVNFSATGLNIGTSPTYQWYLNGSPVGTNSSTYSNSSLTNGNTVYCVVTSNAPCVTGQQATSNTITINVVSPVTTAVSISASATTVCLGTNVVFTATPTNGGASPGYQWYLNGSPIGVGGSTFNSSVLNGDVISCVMTSSVNCVTTPTASSNSISMTVNPVVSTAVGITSSAGSTICSGTSVTFTATPTNGGTPVYQWYVNSTPVGSNSATYVTSALNNGEIVTCHMTSSLSCPNPSTAISNGITMTVNNSAAPTASISSNQGSSICGGTNVTFTASVTNGGSSPIYQWSLNGSPVGTNSSTYSNSTLANGDFVNCVITSNSPCVNGVTASSNTITMSVTTPVTPTVSISSSATTICAGTNITFTATSTNAGGTPVYQWKVNGINSGTNSSAYSSSILNNGDVVTCELTSSLGCVTTNSASSNSIAVTVNPVSATSVSILSSAGSTICSGTSVTFTATPTNGGTPVYQWQLNGGNVGTNSNTYVTSTLNNGDVVSCQMTSSLACATPAIALSNNITMTVNNSAAPTASISSNQGSSICSATSVTFTATVTNGGSSPAYQWYLNSNPVGTNSSTYVNGSLSDNDVVSCSVTSNSPCVNGTTAASNQITMTVTPSVTASVSINASATTICSGTSVTFTATPMNGGTPVYQWQVNGSNAGTNSSTFTTSALTNGQTVTCLMSSSLACATPTIAPSNGITMTVNSSATPTISITSNPTAATICSGTNVTFTASITNGGSSPVYQWKLNGTNVGTNSSIYSNNTLVTGDAVTCELTSNAPCITTTTVLSNSISKTVNSSVTPTITITSNPTMPVCEHQSVTFTATITNGGSNPSYQWKKNGQNYGTGGTTYSTSLWNNGDVFTCVLTSNAACATSATVTSNTITTQEVTIDATTSVSGSTITANQAGATYQWYDCTFQTPINGATQQSYTVTETGLYAVEITLGSCTDESGCELVEFNGINDLSSAGILLYPNPTSDNFTLELPSNARMEMKLYDVSGRIVQEGILDGMVHQIDVHQLATGSYQIVLTDGNNHYVGKVIVNRQ